MIRVHSITTIGLVLVALSGAAWAQDPNQPTTPPTLEERVTKLETAAKKATQTAVPGSLLKIDGRMFAGIFDTGHAGSFPSRAVDMPDAKIRFTFTPNDYVTAVMRMSVNRAAFNNFDYFYLDLKNWGGLFPGQTLRLGKHKIDFGEETIVDNPVENIMITNSVAHVSGYAPGIQAFGPITRKGVLVTYSTALLNGDKNFTVPSQAAGMAWDAKLGVSPASELYFSASTYNGAKTPPAGPDFSIADGAPPAAASTWRRSAWELDARYGYGRTGFKSIVGSTADVPFMFAAAYGHYKDSFTAAPDLKGNYWYAEGLYNVTPKVYAAARYSEIALDNGALSKLGDGTMKSPVPVNKYDRVSVGLGYRLAQFTHVKAEYTINDTKGGASKPSLNQFAIGIATKF